MRTFYFSAIRRWLTYVGLALILLLSSCSFPNIPGINIVTSTPPAPAGPTATPQPSASITFRVALPLPLPAGEVLALSLVDELTGLGLNPINYPMQGMDSTHYSVTIPLSLNSIVKYRYMRQGSLPILEATSFNQPVRYRMVHVTNPGELDDVVSAWADAPFSGPVGRIAGQIIDSTDLAFIPDILISAGGQQTLTDSSGHFALENLPPGTHNLIAFSIDGVYQTLQQGARVEAGKTTQGNLTLVRSSMTNVTFTVAVPANTIPNVPVRLAGNLYQLGDTFGDLMGGLSTVASRMPLLTLLPDGRYSITLSLPAGGDFRYKYTLGDGFWNAEHNADGSFVVRQFIVPSEQSHLQIQDTISTWQAGPSSPILFEATVPANTPAADVPSIQFNPYGWTEPIPMWPKGNNQWVYQLYSPLNMLGEFTYRYCRNDQCGIADDVETAAGKSGRVVSTSLAPEDLQDKVKSWTWFQPVQPAPQIGLPVARREGSFWAGVEFLPEADPSWKAWYPLAIQNVQALQGNWLVLQPSWTLSQADPLILNPVAGADPLSMDWLDTVSRARAAHLNVALYPTIRLPQPDTWASWWTAAPRGPDWWNAWFSRYSAFALNYADLAAQSGAQSLVLGGDAALPAIPGGSLADGSPSGVPSDASARWETLFTQVRQHFSGQILWAISYPGNLASAPDFLHSLDGTYLLWYAPLTGASIDDLAASIGQKLDTDIQPFENSLGTQLIIAAAYPSAQSSATASIPLDAALRPGNADLALNLQAQADIVQALMRAINDRPWIGGFVSRGYYPPIGLQDTSASIHSKPSADVLWYWYPRFLGTAH